MTTYDEWKSTEPSDPYDEELELERRDAEMEPDEQDWSGLNDEAGDVNVITGEVDVLHADYSYLERKARREDGPEANFWKGMRK